MHIHESSYFCDRGRDSEEFLQVWHLFSALPGQDPNQSAFLRGQISYPLVSTLMVLQLAWEKQPVRKKRAFNMKIIVIKYHGKIQEQLCTMKCMR